MKYTINIRDFLKGLIVAGISPVVPIVLQSLNAGSLVFNWTLIGVTALSAMIGYLVKNFLTDEVKQAEKVIRINEKKKAMRKVA